MNTIPNLGFPIYSKNIRNCNQIVPDSKLSRSLEACSVNSVGWTKSSQKVHLKLPSWQVCGSENRNKAKQMQAYH